MGGVELRQVGQVAFREAIPDGRERGDPVLCLHGFPETSYMWRHLLPAIASNGHRAVAPDFPGFGASAADPPASWERLVEFTERFVVSLGLDRVVLVVHDWGGLIGLRWACDHPGRVAALVISDSGFFPDGSWHGMAQGLRTPEVGEEMLAGLDRASFGQLMAASSSGLEEGALDEYWRSLGREEGRRATLEMYRSGDFEKLRPYEGALASLGVPTLLLWGERDEFAPLAGAHRFRREIPGARLEVVEGAGHFIYADAPERCAEAVVGFIGGL